MATKGSTTEPEGDKVLVTDEKGKEHSGTVVEYLGFAHGDAIVKVGSKTVRASSNSEAEGWRWQSLAE